MNPETLRNWVKQAKIDRGQGPVGALTTAERQEFTRLRRRVVELEQERSILVKAAVFFAKETTRWDAFGSSTRRRRTTRCD